jgi:acyl-CoA reductase-like NAD-dependent aldehyde dehydrogenase
LSTIVALETGTPKIASGAAPHAAADHFRYYAGWIDKIEGNVTPVDAQETLNYSVLEPYGVVAVILTWNSLSTRSGAPLRRHWQQATP